MTPPDPQFLATAVEIVLRAGEIQQRRQATGFRIAKKGTIDLVTEVDLECEQLCRAVLAERFPEHDILAEELSSDPSAAPRARYRWVFDPLDGTTNYAHGLPIYCASLALECDGRTIVGAVFDPSRQELFTAERGGGAYLNGQPLRPSTTATLLDALLVTGFPYDVQRKLDELVDMFGAFLGASRAVRRLGSAALDLCYVAAGRFDGFWEQWLRPWDVAAGALLVEEAGGTVTGMDGSPFDAVAGHLVASNGPLHPAILAIIAERRQARLPESRRGDRAK
jgi:myo-inositol-1(or 4)-monophosphatase